MDVGVLGAAIGAARFVLLQLPLQPAEVAVAGIDRVVLVVGRVGDVGVDIAWLEGGVGFPIQKDVGQVQVWPRPVVVRSLQLVAIGGELLLQVGLAQQPEVDVVEG